MSKSTKIYLDYASATPIDGSVLKVMVKILKENFANTSAIHEWGTRGKIILEKAREEIAQVLHSHPNEIIFTSGATESNNLAILGILKNKERNLPHIITTNIEHASVLEVCKYLEKTKKAEITYVEVESNGVVDIKKIKKAIKSNTILVSVMYVNNEIGTIQGIREIAKEIRHYMKINSRKIYFHTDATQAMNYLPVNVLELGVDLMSFNAGKIYGPKGVGVLYVKRNTPIQKVMFGGEQEFNLRAGTENIVNVVGLVQALKVTEKLKEKEVIRLIKLRNYFMKKLIHSNMGADFRMTINGSLEKRLPNNINITIPKIPSILLVIELSARGIMASSKSACKAGDGKASHVIRAIRKDTDLSTEALAEVDGSLRFSLGRQTTKKDIDYTIRTLSEILNKLKKWYY